MIKAFGELALGGDESRNAESEISTMGTWLVAPEPQIQICACLFLGNSIYNQSIKSDVLISRQDLGSSLAQCISLTTDLEALSSSFDLLQNLAVDPKIREHLGAEGVLEALALCWSPDTANNQASRKA